MTRDRTVASGSTIEEGGRSGAICLSPSSVEETGCGTIQRMDDSKIHERGWWLTRDPLDPDATHCFDERLANALARFFTATSVVDLGCGDGSYTRALRDAEIECRGYDGNPNTPEMSGGLCEVLDLSR